MSKDKKEKGFGKMKDLEELDSRFGLKNPSELIIDGDKKKKKKKDKDKDAKDLSLKEMSKSQLRDRVAKMGIDTVGLDLDSKKSMRKAIKAAKEQRKLQSGTLDRNGKPQKEYRKVDPPEGMLSIGTPGLQPSSYRPEPQQPKFYYNAPGDNFIIHDPIGRTDMECYEAMKALGGMRQKARPDDGFGELVSRIQSKIDNGEFDDQKSEEKVIEVKNLAEDKPKLPKHDRVIVPAAQAVVLEPQEVEKMAQDVDAAIAKMREASQELANNRAKNGGKKKGKK